MSPENDGISTPRDILDAALAKEESALRFYEKLLTDSKVTMVRDLIEELRDQEALHVRLIKKRLVLLNLGKG